MTDQHSLTVVVSLHPAAGCQQPGKPPPKRTSEVSRFPWLVQPHLFLWCWVVVGVLPKAAASGSNAIDPPGDLPYNNCKQPRDELSNAR